MDITTEGVTAGVTAVVTTVIVLVDETKAREAVCITVDGMLVVGLCVWELVEEPEDAEVVETVDGEVVTTVDETPAVTYCVSIEESDIEDEVLGVSPVGDEDDVTEVVFTFTGLLSG